ncbi:MAG: response regulator [Deltaproteobacteria bacterium]|jgi:signal transduction histidine kinase/DNA-binding response OmpR family regulator|nr:response regulator [Deltaproteobacteria bacterium]
MKNNTILRQTISIVSVVLVSLSIYLILIMNFFMDGLTDNIMLHIMQPLAKAAAQSAEGHLHTLVNHFFMLRDNSALASPASSTRTKLSIMEKAAAGQDLIWLGLYNWNGELYLGVGECPESIYGRKLYTKLIETRNMVIEDSSEGADGLEIAMGLPIGALPEADPVQGPQGNGYYLAGGYKYDVLDDILSVINIGTNSTAFIINENGALIAHTDIHKVLNRETLLQSLGTDIPLRMQRGEIDSVKMDVDYKRLYISFAPIRGTNWSLGIQALRGDFMSMPRQAILTSVSIVAAALIFCIVILNVFIRGVLSYPLHAIIEKAGEIALGDFARSLDDKLVHREDEVGRLSHAFNNMSDSIQWALKDIRRLTGAVRAGALDKRADCAAYYGDYRNIISGINVTLDTFCVYLNLMPSALMLFDGMRKPIYRNLTMARLLALHTAVAESANQLAYIVSSGLSSLLPPEADQLFAPELEGDDAYHADITLSDRGGGVFNYSMSLKRVGGRSGEGTEEDVCVMLILNDVTMLARARDAANAGSRAKGDFLSRMSHEMRTPMNAIIGMTAIGKNAHDLERKEYCLDKINEASQHLLGVINDILDMSKIEADKFELSLSEFNFEKMLQRVINVINFKVEEKKQNFFIDLDPCIPANLVSDEQRLAQVIANLLSNAVKFTPDNGAITLKAGLASQEGELCLLRVEVKDTGIGLSAEQQARLFRSFEQADGSISRKFGGTGLGLVISKRIVELMDGRIWIESELGHGAAFIFEIKAVQGTETGSGPSSVVRDWSSLRVLAVDDFADVLQLFKSVLTPLGVTCDLASSGGEALELIGSRPPYNIIFIDLRMPEMDGLELARRIAPGPQLILFTGEDWTAIEQEARGAGISHFLQKPLFASSLLDCITRQINPFEDRTMERHSGSSASDDNIFADKQVLVAEDVDINREIVQALLEHTGLNMDFAFDGRQAVDKFSASPHKYDLILMDVHMPNVDGYEATRLIRSSGLDRALDIPIVAMTANVFREDVERCLAAGMNSHLGKPIDAAEVIAAIKRFVLREKAQS